MTSKTGYRESPSFSGQCLPKCPAYSSAAGVGDLKGHKKFWNIETQKGPDKPANTPTDQKIQMSHERCVPCKLLNKNATEYQ